MTFVPPFLLALELAPDADERAIRRAYAKRLRLIDQEADPAGFQQLREVFERALRWQAMRDRRGVAAAPPPDEAEESRAEAAPVVVAGPGTTPARPPVGEPVLAQAQVLGESAFADFAHAVATGLADETAAAALLARTLADERLVNMDASAWFEFLVARRLVDGWRPGHEFLFRPAGKAFDWERDRRRLQLHGPVGQVIDSAITERLIFYGLARAEFERLVDMIRRLRDDAPPSDSELRTRMAALQLLMQRYPNFVRVLAPLANVQAWRMRWQALAPETRATIAAAGPATWPDKPFTPPKSPAGSHAPAAAAARKPQSVAGWLFPVVAILMMLARCAANAPIATGHAPAVGLQLSQEFDGTGSDTARRQKDAEQALSAALAQAKPPAARKGPAPRSGPPDPPQWQLPGPAQPAPDPFPLSVEYTPAAAASTNGR